MVSVEQQGHILHVMQTRAVKSSVEVKHWYYDIQTKKKSVGGKLGDPCNTPMSNLDIKHAYRMCGLIRPSRSTGAPRLQELLRLESAHASIVSTQIPQTDAASPEPFI